ncbi:hypothetical protein CLOP_g1600, partial [Closterium sp. NIES-67]
LDTITPSGPWGKDNSGVSWRGSVVATRRNRIGFQRSQINRFQGVGRALPAKGASRQFGRTNRREDDFNEWNADDAYDTEAIDVEAREGWGLEEERLLQRLVERLEGTPLSASPRHVSRAVRSAGVRLSPRRVALAARLLASKGSWRRALLLVHWAARRDQSRVDRKVLTSLIAALGWRYPDAVLQVMRMMMSQPATWPDLPAYRAAAVALGRAGYLQELLQMMQELREGPARTNRAEPLETVGSGGDGDDGDGNSRAANGPSDRPRNQGSSSNSRSSWLAPDVVVYNALLNACGAKRQWKGVQWALQQMRHEGVTPDSATFGLAIQAMSLCSQTHYALQLLADMEAAGFSPTTRTYR